MKFESITPEQFGDSLKTMGMPDWQAEGLLEDFAHYERNEASEVTDDVEKVSGCKARSLDDFIRDYGAAFRS